MPEKETIRIRRNAQEYLMLKGGAIEIKLKESELEQAFRIRSKQYRMEDIEDAIQSAYDLGSIAEDVYRKCINSPEIKRAVLEQYDKIYSCDTAYNDTIKEAVKRVTARLQDNVHDSSAEWATADNGRK